MKRTMKSLLAAASLATGLGLAAASTLTLAQATSPFPSAPDDPSITAPSASQGRQGHGGRHHGQHAGQGGREGMSQADREARRAAMDKLTTPEERTAFRERMRGATPEQRPQLMAAHRAELEQRAKARGVTMPVMQRQGGRHGQGMSHEGMRGQHRHGMPGSLVTTPSPAPAQPSAPAAPASM